MRSDKRRKERRALKQQQDAPPKEKRRRDNILQVPQPKLSISGQSCFLHIHCHELYVFSLSLER